MRTDAHSSAGFENQNRQPPDTSGFSIAEYERDRCQTTMAALARRYYAQAYESQCSSGELTAQLARICAHVTATDIAPSAVARARQRCAHLHNVNIYRGDIAEHEPPGSFDLVVLSERGRYFAPSDLIRVAEKLCDSLALGGELVAVHWLGTGHDHVLHGDAVHSLLLANLPLQWLKGDRQRGFRMDSWLRI